MKPGDMILYYKNDTSVKCQTGWAGRNCDACAPNFGPLGQCNRCKRFAFSVDSKCSGCIRNGQWIGKWYNFFTLTATLTFDGPTCSNLVSGMYRITLWKGRKVIEFLLQDFTEICDSNILVEYEV